MMNPIATQRLRNLKTARNRFRQRIRSKLKAKALRKAGQNFRSKFSIRSSSRKGEYRVDLLVPDTLCLDANYDQTVEFIKELRTLALRHRKPVRIVFSNAKIIKPSALLLLLAEIHRCRLVRGVRLVSGTYPSNQKLERMLCASGFFDILDVKNRIHPKRNYPMEYIKFASSDRLQEHQSRKLRAELLGEKIEMQSAPRRRLQRAITEAMLNAVQHAYPLGSTKSNPGRNRWWLTGSYNRKTKNLTIMFADLGVGIPSTLTKLYFIEHIRSALSMLPGVQISDGQMIKAAMALGRTRTGASGRGRGLNDLRYFIDQASGGELKIFSNKGSYTYHAGGLEETDNYNDSIGGTLIKWSVPIVNVTNWCGENDEYEAEDN